MPAVVAFLKNRRALVTLALSLACVFLIYDRGRVDCARKVEKAEARIKDEWASRIGEASAFAYERGREAAAADRANEDKVDEIENAARKEPGSTDVCLSADVVDLLRQLQ